MALFIDYGSHTNASGKDTATPHGHHEVVWRSEPHPSAQSTLRFEDQGQKRRHGSLQAGPNSPGPDSAGDPHEFDLENPPEDFCIPEILNIDLGPNFPKDYTIQDPAQQGFGGNVDLATRENEEEGEDMR